MEFEDIDKYIGYNAEHKSWSVHFLNENSFGLFEVKDVFKKFGEARVVQTKSATGYCFVNFFTKENARECVQGMKDHAFIKLSQRRKNDPEPIVPEEKKNKSQQHRLTIPSHLVEEKDKNNSFSVKAASEVKLTTNIEHTKTMEEKSPMKNLSTAHASSQGELSQPGSESLSGLEVNDIKIQKIIQEVPKSIVPEFPAEISTIVQNDMESFTKEEIFNSPVSFPTSSRKFDQVIEAQEVIVANIPEEYGVCFILHLMEKYQPISISSMKTLPSTSVNYCHVYFTNLSAAETVETVFDDMQLAENKIIVLRANSLAQQAMAG